MKKVVVITVLCLFLAGCAVRPSLHAGRNEKTFLDVFDTVTTVIGSAELADDFGQTAQNIHEELLYYHKLFDIYHEYEGQNNLYTVNANAGIAPVTVAPALLEFLKDCKEYYTLTDGRVNVALGGVLRLWHEARENALDDAQNAALPDKTALRNAAAHCSIDAIVLNEENSTVYLSDPLVQLDVGAIAKGWATQKAAQNAPSGILLSVGGNVCATGPKQAPDTPWVVGVENPDGEGYLQKVEVQKGSVVTSGDYQRYFTVAGRNYHHIIDPKTLCPADRWRSVTVICDDSGLADALSTALFLMSQADGTALLQEVGAEAMWLSVDGEIYTSDGFGRYICR